jgi:hypothetical protein
MKKEMAEMRFLRAVAGYKMQYHTRNEQLGITDINAIMRAGIAQWYSAGLRAG